MFRPLSLSLLLYLCCTGFYIFQDQQVFSQMTIFRFHIGLYSIYIPTIEREREKSFRQINALDSLTLKCLTLRCVAIQWPAFFTPLFVGLILFFLLLLHLFSFPHESVRLIHRSSSQLFSLVACSTWYQKDSFKPR